jgi:hypothetical protein
MFGLKSFASYSFSAYNDDGVLIYYQFIGDNRVEVRAGPEKYSGNVVIPDEANYLGNSYQVTHIGEKAFYECTDLTSVSIGDNVIFIYDYAFAGCSGLTYLKLSNKLQNTGIYAFRGCTSLTTLTLPENMGAIGGGAFSGCTSLQSITIPDNIGAIWSSAFASCVSVTTITIGKGVSFFGGCALACGDNVETVYSMIENPKEIDGMSLGTMVFTQHTFRNATLYVPDESVEKYKTTKGWKDFVTIKPISAAYKHTLSYVVDDELYVSYEINEGDIITPEPAPEKEGYTFSGWSEIPETMPDHNVTVTGYFTINKYKLTYIVDGEVYKSSEVEYNSTISPEPAPQREGYTFSGWREIPETMPAHDVTVTGTFTINKYKITYIVDGNVVATQDVEYGSTIVPPATDSNGNAISWNSHPTTMPAYDITIYGSYTTTIDAINNVKCKIKYYTLDGQPIEQPRKDVNIVRMSDGTVNKVVIK